MILAVLCLLSANLPAQRKSACLAIGLLGDRSNLPRQPNCRLLPERAILNDKSIAGSAA